MMGWDGDGGDVIDRVGRGWRLRLEGEEQRRLRLVAEAGGCACGRRESANGSGGQAAV